MDWLVSIGAYLWNLFSIWLHTLFVAPFSNLDILWLMVPVWVTWFFAEFFQEKAGTSMGNAITNAVVVLWGSIDCTRQTLRLMEAGVITDTWNIVLRFALVAVIFLYGATIVYLGWKGNEIIKYIGRIREVTYIFAMFVPIYYNVTEFSWSHLVAAIVFFPLFYFIIELIDRYTPNPQSITKDLKSESSVAAEDSFAGLGNTTFASASTSSTPASSPSKFTPSSSAYPTSTSNSPKYNPEWRKFK